MSLESILSHILNEAGAVKAKIIQDAKLESDRIIQEAKREADSFYAESIEKEKTVYENQKQKRVVNARLEAKKELLKVEQDLIDEVFQKLKSSLAKHKFKKEEIRRDKTEEIGADIDFYLNKMRFDYETEIAKVLFR